MFAASYLAGTFVRQLVWLKYLRRPAHVYLVASVVITTYVVAKVVLSTLLGLNKLRARRWYDAIDALLAPFVADRFVDLRSIWVKIGQYLSARSDVTPLLWAEALKVLQDDVPADSYDDVSKTLKEAYGGVVLTPPEDTENDENDAGSHKKKNKKFVWGLECVFSEFDFDPIASASIAQVHRARLATAEKEEVAVKVMHRGIAVKFREDLRRGLIIARLAAWLNPDFETMATVLSAWEEDLERELDFNLEAANLKAVRRNMLETHRANVVVPDVVAQLPPCACCFAMEYVGGCVKLDDQAALALHGVDEQQLLETVVHVWCCQLFQDNFSNADPHPGNILVKLSDDHGAQPVLLDWGWAVRLEQRELHGLRQFVVAMCDMDVAAAATALKDMGYVNNQDERNPERSVAFFGYLFRPTGSRENATKERDDFFKERKQEKTTDAEAGVREKGGRKVVAIPKSFMTVTRIFGLLRGLCAVCSTKNT